MKKSIPKLAFILLSFYSLHTFAQIGALDPTFGTGGQVTTEIDSDSYISAMALQPDGKIVVLGNHALNFYGWYSVGPVNHSTGYVSNNVVLMARYNTDGTLDNTFGNGGIIKNVLSSQGYARGLAIQTDGKIVVGGGDLLGGNIYLWRYKTNGTLDSTYGINGMVTSSLLGGVGYIGFAFAIQPDGKMLATKNFSTLRFKTNGDLDSTFGTNGLVVINNIYSQQGSWSIEVDASGKILIGGNGFTGSYGGYFIATRLLSNGQTDNSFGTSGVSFALMTGDDGIIATHTFPSGEILIAGNVDVTLVKTSSSGIADPSFGSGGSIRGGYYLNNNTNATNAMAIKTSGDIVLASQGDNDTSQIRKFTIWMLDSVGNTKDSVFTDFYNRTEAGAAAVAIQADGKIIAAGYTNSSGYAQFALARFGGTAIAGPYAGPNQTICQYTTATMAAADSGVWSASPANPANTTFSNQASATSSVSGFNNAGIYAYIWTSAAGTDTMQIIVTAKPDAGPDLAVCLGDTATLAAGSTPGMWTALNSNPTATRIFSNTSASSHVSGFTHSSGTYTFLWAENGCRDTMNVHVNPAVITADSIGNVSCYNGSDGHICISAAGSTTYSYLWSTGDTVACIHLLPAGAYHLTVTDQATGCSASHLYNVTQPSAITLSHSSFPATCYNAANGIINVNPSGGTAPYGYSWFPNVSQSGQATQLTAGTYCVTITDHNGCIDSACYSISQPSALAITADSIYKDTCALSHRGRIVVNTSGGTSPYHYLWNNGDSSGTISSLAAGVYCLSVADFHGCIIDTCFAVLSDSCIGLGIVESANEQFNMQPNPAYSTVQISATQIIQDLYLVDMIGQKIPCEIAMIGNRADINVADLDAACYFVIIKTQKEIAVRKLLVEH